MSTTIINAGSITEQTAKTLNELANRPAPAPSTSKLPQVVDGSVTELTADDSAGATSIRDYAFYNCTSLTSITIPDSVTSIGDSAFSGCSGLESVTIPNSVTSIESSAFSNCSVLDNVIIPVGVVTVGDYCFFNCTHLHVTFLSETPVEISDVEKTFRNVIAIYVPASAVDAYKEAWADVASIISTIPE